MGRSWPWRQEEEGGFRKRDQHVKGLEARQLVIPETRGLSITKESRARGLGRGEAEALKLASSAGAWTPDGGPHRAWQAVNQLGFVTGLLKDSGG